jgi:DNA-binding transcriptional MerR regulator
MKIAEAARECGLTVHTIRFYEKAGLLPEIARSDDGHRQFSREILEWLTLLASLRATGMPMKTMQHFAGLYRQGDATVPERKAVLGDHAQHLEVQQMQLSRCRKLLAQKRARYDEIMGETP